VSHNTVDNRRENKNFSPEDYSSSWIAWPLKTGSTSCPEMSITNYKFAQRNISDERISQGVRRFFGVKWSSHSIIIPKTAYWIKRFGDILGAKSKDNMSN
jgi:hypothetical protein